MCRISSLFMQKLSNAKMQPLEAQSSGLRTLHKLLLRPSSQHCEIPEAAKKHENPIFISFSSHHPKVTVLPLQLTILDLQDLDHVAPHMALSTHTFTCKMPHHHTQNTDPTKRKTELILVTKNSLSLEQLLPQQRSLAVITHQNMENSKKNDVNYTLRALGLDSSTDIMGIFDTEMLARELLPGLESYAHNHVLQRLLKCEVCRPRIDEFAQENETRDVMRILLLIGIESIEKKTMDKKGTARLECLRAVGLGKLSVSSMTPLSFLRDGVKKMGNVLLKSMEDVERKRVERLEMEARKQESETDDQCSTQMTLWDGSWEVV